MQLILDGGSHPHTEIQYDKCDSKRVKYRSLISVSGIQCFILFMVDKE